MTLHVLLRISKYFSVIRQARSLKPTQYSNILLNINIYLLQFLSRRHIQSIHEGVRYQCDECDHAATTTGNLYKHREAVHKHLRSDLCTLSNDMS